MTTSTIALDPTSYDLVEIYNDRAFRAVSAAMQTEGRTGNRWGLSMLFAGLTEAERRELRGYLATLKGQRNRARFYIPNYTPGGTVGGTPLLDGAHSAGATTIAIKGMPLSTSDVLKAGDFITIGNELKTVGSDLDSDGTGDGSVDIWPELHQNYAGDDAIEFDDPSGVFFQTQPATRTLPADQFAATFRLTLEEDILA